MRDYTTHGSTVKTPQSEAIPGREAAMVKNQGGGVTFKLDPWGQFRRFLILGCDAPTYYAKTPKRVKEASAAMRACFAEDGARALAEVVAVSHEGRAKSNDPALFALAYAFTHEDVAVRRLAASNLPRVARIGTHLFHFCEALTAFSKRPGTGRLLRRAVQDWYVEKDADKLAYQLVKYKQRDGWSQRDVLRSCKPGGRVEKHSPHAQLFSWAAGRKTDHAASFTTHSVLDADPWARLVLANDWLHTGISPRSEGDVVKLIKEVGLPREVIPSGHLGSPKVWDALLHAGKFGMPLGALIRNLGKMTSIGLISQGSEAARFVAERLGDKVALTKARIHPLGVLLALRTYGSGRGFKGSLSWQTVPGVMDALDAAFYATFSNVEPTGGRTMLALDVSGSMSVEMIANSSLSARDASAAMAMVTAATEQTAPVVVGFTGGGFDYSRTRVALKPSDCLTPLDLSPRRRLDDNIATVSGLRFGNTDCALPMTYALEKKLEIDTFVIYTDNETWAGEIQPVQALQQYRAKMGINAKLIVVGMVSSGFTIADPTDPGMLDVVGFDAAAPALMGAFARGEV